MKILPVDNKRLQTFRGLWGERNPKTKELKYYPYRGETEEQISNNTSKYKGLVAIMTALPFTSKDWIKYTKNKMSIIKQRWIEKHLIQKGLTTAIK